MKICFATNNANKLFEIKNLLADTSYEVQSLEAIGCKEALPETSDTIAGNSLQKAQYVFDNYQIACFADDTGLEVEALEGAPGIYSARYAGPQRSATDNNTLLLTNLKDEENRKARFKTVISYVCPEGFQQFTGIVNGKITESLSGTAGFGYDPIFLPDGFNRTFAEMDVVQKNQISHRALATRQLIDYLTR